MSKILDGNKQTLTSAYGTGLTTKQKRAVNIIQTPYQDIGQTWGVGANSGNANHAGSVQFTDVGTNGDQITIVDTLGTSKVYQVVSSGTTGTEISAGIVRVRIGASANATGAELATAIESSNGHNGTLDASNSSGTVTITQVKGGNATTGVVTGSITETVDSAGHMTITDFSFQTTGPGNAAYRHTDDTTGLIRTEIHVDLTGLKAKGSDAADVIGLDGVNNAYIYQNLVAKNGIIFKYDVSCIKAPTQEIATITQDIDFAWNASGTLEYDGAAGSPDVNTATLVAGETKTINVANLTANHYLYITEGDTAATTGVYSGGQFVITLYGYAVRT